MRVPAFFAEIGSEQNRPKIQAGIYTGYGTVVSLGAISLWAHHAGLLPETSLVIALLVAKLVTNTLSWIALRARVLHLAAATVNIVCDVLVMTGAVYMTGGPLSPLIPIYFIETTVMALLTNVGLTVLTTVGCFVCYAVMCLLVSAHVWPLLPTPFERVGGMTPGYVGVILATGAVLLFVPGIYVSLIVQRLRANETALEAHAAALTEAARTKSQLVANVTHELRTPIHGILGLSDLLTEGIYGPVTPEQKEAVRGIQESGRNLLEMIDTLLTLARAEAAKLEVSLGSVSVDELVTSVASTARWLRGHKDLRVTTEVAPDLLPIESDRGKLVQVLVNLLANGVKFTPEHGEVHLRAEPYAHGVEFSVRDTGIGIAASDLERIFEAFHQVDGSASRTYGGMGLGLAIVKKLCTFLHAEVSVESTLGEGSTFRVRVPRAFSPPSV